MLTAIDVHKFLSEIGVKSTDTIVVHSSMRALGEVEGGCDGLIDAFCSYLTDGLLIIPTHTWGSVGASNPIYDVRITSPCIGALPTVACFRKDGVRSLHPTHSVTAFGKRAKEFVKGEENCTSPCTPNGIWARLYDENAKILLVGVGLNSNTYIHAIDERYNIKTRFGKEIKLGKVIDITIIDADGKSQVISTRRHGWTGSREFERYTEAFERAGILTYAMLGSAKVGIMDANKSASVMAEIFTREEFI